MRNYDSALEQMRACGLRLDDLIINGQVQRCKVDGRRERAGWYVAHLWQTDSGDEFVTGSFGIWVGNDNNVQKIELHESFLKTNEEREAYLRRIKEDSAKAKYQRHNDVQKARGRALHLWHHLADKGDCDYLRKKDIKPYGVRFTKRNSMVIPMVDIQGNLQGCQVILDSQKSKARIDRIGRNKEFFPRGMEKKGTFHLIGMPVDTLFIAEGYATAASIFDATGIPVAVAFDAGNIEPVISQLRRHYKKCKMIVAADNDHLARCHCGARFDLNAHPELCPECQNPHKKKNAGINAATLSANAHGALFVYPVFEQEDKKIKRWIDSGEKQTDFNDLHNEESLSAVRKCIEKQLDRLGAKGCLRSKNKKRDRESQLIADVLEFNDRFTLVSGMNGMLFDHKEKRLVTTKDAQMLCLVRNIWRDWLERKDRKVVLTENVGFDPPCKDKTILCNLWRGIEMQAIKGQCSSILLLLRTMCSGEQALYEWLLKWFAYPLQHIGAKMQTALVVHGLQGVGKNLIFECLGSIYGEYFIILDQVMLEDKFNTWASKKLFVIGDEVIARQDMYTDKNKLKTFITGKTININPKGVNSYTEVNHMNIVFLSNERNPVVIESDDRRFAVIWIGEKLEDDCYKEVADEMANGGVEAFYHYLLHLDLGDFNEHTKPPLSTAKLKLIELNKESPARFVENWLHSDLGGAPLSPAKTQDVYEFYRSWCRQKGERARSERVFSDFIVHKCHVKRFDRQRYQDGMLVRQCSYFVPPNAVDKPPEMSDRVWLGECFKQFAMALKEFKNNGVLYDD